MLVKGNKPETSVRFIVDFMCECQRDFARTMQELAGFAVRTIYKVLTLFSSLPTNLNMTITFVEFEGVWGLQVSSL